ncbi:alpha/beta-hydrolase [Podospora aff. communis PSN243]|uniref:Carboxylic ester hydrolase n=1 Tax=Podospora aff. communis PSN243 TaxID=3040156 RepID=A0AAV9GY60_9PEZI|nr:alpha/beta-hydrolase [Podospora aff. communis PSN243]
MGSAEETAALSRPKSPNVGAEKRAGGEAGDDIISAPARLPLLHPSRTARGLFLVGLLFVQLASWKCFSLPLVTVRNGTYAGVHSSAFRQDFFLGVPYAQDTGGPNRFRIPQSLNTSWAGVRTAQQYSHACPSDTPDGDDKYGMSENCLSINIVRPSGVRHGDRLPVMFYIHGGSYQVGTSGWDRYNLSFIVQHSVNIGRPVVAATINYRKAGWGFLYSAEVQESGNANLALRDMRQALAWVQENIAAFGGDPNKVTIWGESAGSFAVGQLLMSYGGRTDGLFHRTIQESGSTTTAWYNGTDWYQPLYDRLVSLTGCASALSTLDCLRSVPYSTLYPLLTASPVSGPYYPVVDRDIIPDYPTALLQTGRFAHMPHILGTNSDEGTDNTPRGLSTTADLSSYLTNHGFNYPPSVISDIFRLYPDDPAVGIPLNTGEVRFAHMGRQYKRAAAIIGDIYYHAPRLNDARYYSLHQPNNTFVFRFNTRAWIPPLPYTQANFSYEIACPGKAPQDCGALAPAHQGVAHATELAFVFGNPRWLGPWEGYRELSERMMSMWITFVHDGTPNGQEEVWPEYRRRQEGVNLVLQTREQGGLRVEGDTWRLEGRELLTKWAGRRHV